MRRMLPLFALLSLAFAPESKPDTAKEDARKLQGAWTATTVEKAGVKVEGATVQVTFKDDSLKLFEDGKLIAVATCRLQVDGITRIIHQNEMKKPPRESNLLTGKFLNSHQEAEDECTDGVAGSHQVFILRSHFFPDQRRVGFP